MSARILVGDALDMLRTLEPESVQVCVTSPPYFGLRDYGAAGQMGLEQTPSEFISKLVAVFDEVKRVLRPDGLCFVNLGDSYAGSGKGPTGGNGIGDQESRQGFRAGSARADGVVDGRSIRNRTDAVPVASIPAKNLLLIPERFAIAMQDAGWVVRSRIAWCKKSPMPESVRDRPTSAWEHIWMFSKSARYYYDAEAVRAPLADGSAARYVQDFKDKRSGTTKGLRVAGEAQPRGDAVPTRSLDVPSGANLRNFWLLGPSPFADAHFATFPPEIPRRCILAGTSEKGACPACGAPWRRSPSHPCEACGAPIPQQAKSCPSCSHVRDWKAGRTAQPEMVATDWSTPGRGTPRLPGGFKNTNTASEWTPSCTCPPADPVPCVVLDPFLGSGTTALVADQLGRHAVGIELSPTYAAMAEQRIAGDCPMFTNVEVIQGMTRDMMGQHDHAAS